MIRRHGAWLRAVLMGADAAVALALLAGLSTARFGPGWQANWSLLFADPLAPALLYTLGWVLMLYLVGAYRVRAQWSLRTEAAAIIRAAFYMAFAAATVLFFTKSQDVSRLFLLLLFPAQAVVTIATRAVLRWQLERLRESGHNSRNVLVLGTGPRARDFARQLEEHSALGLRVVGFVGERASNLPRRAQWLGDLKALETVLHDNIVDEVAICLSTGDWSLVEALVALCEEEGKVVRIPLEIPQLGSERRFVEDLDGTPVLSLVRGPDHLLALAVKRMLDLVGASLGLVVLSPVFGAVAVYIRRKDGKPVLFRQTRVGVNGRPFTIYKFRTMVKDAEERYEEVVTLSDTKGAAFKMSNDPRITSWGRLLRKSSLDELPQLWNVFKGEMSLIGPRPAPPREVDGYDIWHRRRLTMKPGITGMWQISSRLDDDFSERAKLDLAYIDRWSLWLDFKIAVKTVPTLLRPAGR